MSNKKLKKIHLNNDDLSLVNQSRYGQTSFAIQRLSNDIFDDDLAANLERYLENNNIPSDMFNVEYMGFLTGQVKIGNKEIESIIPLVNMFINQIE